MASHNPREGHIRNYSQPQGVVYPKESGLIHSSYEHLPQNHTHPQQQQQQHPQYQKVYIQDRIFSQPELPLHFSGLISPIHQQQLHPIYPSPSQRYEQLPYVPPQAPPNHPYNHQEYSAQSYHIPLPGPPSPWHLGEMKEMEKKNRDLHQKVETLEKDNLVLSNRLQIIQDYLQPKSKWSMQHIPDLDQLIAELRNAKPHTGYDPILYKCEQISQVLNYIFYPNPHTTPVEAPDNTSVSQHQHYTASETQP